MTKLLHVALSVTLDKVISYSCVFTLSRDAKESCRPTQLFFIFRISLFWITYPILFCVQVRPVYMKNRYAILLLILSCNGYSIRKSFVLFLEPREVGLDL